MFKLASSLNGNNGEYTNTDDLAASAPRRDNLNSRGTGGKSKQKQEPRVDYQQSIKQRLGIKKDTLVTLGDIHKILQDNNISLHPDPSGAQPPDPGVPIVTGLTPPVVKVSAPKVIVRCVRSQYFPACSSAKTPSGIVHFDFTLNQFRCPFTGELFDFVDENQLIPNCKNGSWGYVEIYTEPGKGKNFAAQGLYGKMLIHDSKVGSKYYKEQSEYYYFDVYSSLTHKFPSATIVEHVLKAALASCEKERMGYDPRFIRATVDWFAFCKTKSYVSVSGNQSAARVLEGDIDQWELENYRVYYETHDCLEFYRPRSIYPVECTLPIDWDYREDYEADCRLSSFPDFNSPDLVPAFNTLVRPLGLQPKWTTKVFYDIHGNTPFLVYDNTPNNMLLATKRLVARRPLEDLYNLYSTTLVAYLARDTSLQWYKHHQLTTNKLVKLLHIDTTLAPVNESFCRFFSDKIRQLLSNVNRSTIGRWVDNFNTGCHWTYYKGFDAYLEVMAPYFSREYNANIPHVKQKLRQSYIMGELLHEDENNMVKRLNACVKREFAKPGKVPRLFVTYEAGCMYANELPEWIKICLDGLHVYTHAGVTLMQFIVGKPRRDTLTEVFDMILSSLDTRDTIFHLVYSDDSVISGNVKGQPFCFCVDISMCDAGQHELIFFITGLAMGNFHTDRAVGLVSQCTQPITLSNPWAKGETITLKFNQFEGSGSVLTTILNHFGNSAGGMALLYLVSNLSGSTSRREIQQLIHQAYCMIGHKVTVEDTFVDDSFVFEKVQFLKHSPILTTCGKYIPVINYGCVFRSLGKVEDCLDHIKLGVTPSQYALMSYSEMMDRFWSSVVKGFIHQPQSVIFDALRDRFNVEVPAIASGSVLTKILDLSYDEKILRYEFGEPAGFFLDCSHYTLDTESLCKRYDCTCDDLTALASMITALALGRSQLSIAVDCFYKVDYGLD